MNMLTQALELLKSVPVEEVAPTGATLLDVQPDAENAEGVEWVTLTGTRYPTLDSVPWQARGSAVKVPLP